MSLNQNHIALLVKPQKKVKKELNLREILTKDWITIFCELLDRKTRSLAHKINEKYNHKPPSHKFHNNNKHKHILFKKKKRLSY